MMGLTDLAGRQAGYQSFHGYPVPADAAPWGANWRVFSVPTGQPSGVRKWPAFIRGDGAEANSPEEIARIDRESPMPRPPILVGQVWHLPNGWLAITRPVGGRPVVTMDRADGSGYFIFDELPSGSDLVWGPFAPWQDTGGP